MHSIKFRFALATFILINILLYSFIILFNTNVPLHRFNYVMNAHHYLEDERINAGSFNLLRGLGQFDAQWYLKIADSGYPVNPNNINLNRKDVMNGLTYAFFPLYPLTIYLINVAIHNVELSAFILSNVLLIVNFCSLYFVIQKVSNENLARKTVFLFFLFPVSIFYRSYFAEGLFLFFLIWFAYYLLHKEYRLSSLALSLLLITKPNSLVLEGLFVYYLIKASFRKEMSKNDACIAFITSVLPFIGWLGFCYLYTGDPLYWLSVQSAWYPGQQLFSTFFHNLSTISQFPSLAWHLFHSSKIDVITIFVVGILLIVSRKKLKPEFWWISLLLWLPPLLIKDTISFTRYQIVSFPLFFYVGQHLRGVYYWLVVGLFLLGLCITSLYFVDWYWIG